MEEVKEIKMTEKQEPKTYQWIKSEYMGKVVVVSEEQPNTKFLQFTDGSRINKTLIREYLMEVPTGTKGINDLEIPQTRPVQDQTSTVATNTSAPVITQPLVKEPSVMGKMITKMSKKNVVTVPVQINLNIPTVDIYTMLSGGMETEDLNEEIMEVALQQIEINKLHDYIKENVAQFLQEY
jgi:hypothetical protein